MTTRPTAAGVIDSVLSPLGGDVAVAGVRNALLAALDQAGIRTYHVDDATKCGVVGAVNVKFKRGMRVTLIHEDPSPAEADRASIEDVVATAEKADADVARIRRRATNAGPAEIGDFSPTGQRLVDPPAEAE